MTEQKTVALALTGASGMPYALRLLQLLVSANCQLYLMVSKPAQVVLGMETELRLPARSSDMQAHLTATYRAAAGQLRVFGQDEWTAPVASGSAVPDAMIVCPCTTGTLASIAAGSCNNLIDRAADVVIKENRQLILMPREMPFSAIHLENMLKLARLGVTIMPPNPAFYNHPQSLDDAVDFVVARVLDQLGIAQQLIPRWGVKD